MADSLCPFFSASSACANRHWHVASTTSFVIKLKGCLKMKPIKTPFRSVKTITGPYLMPDTGLKAFPLANGANFDLRLLLASSLVLEAKRLILFSTSSSSSEGPRSPFLPRVMSTFLQPTQRQDLVHPILAS